MTTRILRKRKRTPAKFDALSVFAAWAQEHNTPITAPDAVAQFTNFLAASLKESIASDTMLYGNRAQLMFEAVVANLGEAQLVKSEDVGNVYSHHDELEIPDTRIVLADGSQILVETKNHHESPDKPYRIKKTCLDGLLNYARLVGCKLRVAIFWSRMRRWTLIAPSAFKQNGKRMEVDFSSAFTANDTGILGDKIIGCPYPVSIRVYIHKLRNGEWRMRTDKFRFFASGREVLRPQQRKMLFFLMLWGGWAMDPPRVVEEDDDKRIVEMIFMPHEEAQQGVKDSQGGCVLNEFLSSVLSRYWLQITSTVDGEFLTMLPGLEEWSDQLLELTNEKEPLFAICRVASTLDALKEDQQAT